MKMFDGILKNRVFIPVMAAVGGIQLLLVYFGGEMVRTVALDMQELILSIVIAAAVIPAQLAVGALLKAAGLKNEL